MLRFSRRLALQTSLPRAECREGTPWGQAMSLQGRKNATRTLTAMTACTLPTALRVIWLISSSEELQEKVGQILQTRKLGRALKHRVSEDRAQL